MGALFVLLESPWRVGFNEGDLEEVINPKGLGDIDSSLFIGNSIKQKKNGKKN